MEEPLRKWAKAVAFAAAAALLYGAIHSLHAPLAADRGPKTTARIEEERPEPKTANVENATHPARLSDAQREALRALGAAAPFAIVDPVAPQDDVAQMAALRALLNRDPEQALRTAQDDAARSPDSPDAAERASIVVKALMRMGRAEEATTEARAMVEKYPDTSWALDVKHHMLDIPSYQPPAQ